MNSFNFPENYGSLKTQNYGSINFDSQPEDHPTEPVIDDIEYDQDLNSVVLKTEILHKKHKILKSKSKMKIMKQSERVLQMEKAKKQSIDN